MNFNWIKCFLEYANTGSYNEAAQTLFYSPQTVLRYIQSLEKYLDVVLIDRSSDDSSKLTVAGDYFRSTFGAMMQQLETLSDNTLQTDSHSLRVGFSEYIDLKGLVGSAIIDFTERYPLINLSCVHAGNKTILTLLRAGELDCALFSEAHIPPDSNLERTPVGNEELCLYGPENVIGESLAQEARQQRSRLPYFVCGNEKTRFESDVFCSLEQKNFTTSFHAVGQVPNISSMVAEMSAGKGLAVSDAKFGFLCSVPGLGRESLHTDTCIYVCSFFTNENPDTEVFIRDIRKSFGYLPPQ